jgi:biopolymer transport protein TolR
MAEINIVPYIDVMLVLLVVFMITAPLINQGVEIDLPQTEANPLPAESVQPLVLRVDRSGLYYLDVGDGNTSALDRAAVIARAAAVLRRNPNTPVVVEADSNVEYGSVIVGMSLLKQSGAVKVGLATRPIER